MNTQVPDTWTNEAEIRRWLQRQGVMVRLWLDESKVDELVSGIVELYNGAFNKARDMTLSEQAQTPFRVIRTEDAMPEPNTTVIVAGGLAQWNGREWHSFMDLSGTRPIQWPVKWWAALVYDVEVPDGKHA